MNDLKKITIRVTPEVFDVLDDAAHATRLPLAVYVRELVISKAPPVAPPLVDAMSEATKRLVMVLAGVTNNLSQIDQKMAALGDPLSRLSGEEGALKALRKIAFQVAMAAKSGQVNAELSEQILAATSIEKSGLVLNELATNLNSGMTPLGSHVHSILTSLKSSLEACQDLAK